MITTIIDRSKWLRGEGFAVSYLLRVKDSKMCCLGFAGLAAGATEEDIIGKKSPSEVLGHSEFRMPGLLDKNGYETPVCNNLMSVNDQIGLCEVNRERELKKFAAEAGYRFIFAPHWLTPILRWWHKTL